MLRDIEYIIDNIKYKWDGCPVIIYEYVLHKRGSEWGRISQVKVGDIWGEFDAYVDLSELRLFTDKDKEAFKKDPYKGFKM